MIVKKNLLNNIKFGDNNLRKIKYSFHFLKIDQHLNICQQINN